MLLVSHSGVSLRDLYGASLIWIIFFLQQISSTWDVLIFGTESELQRLLCKDEMIRVEWEWN